MNYNAAGQLVGLTDPLGQVTSMVYVGNLLHSITNKSGQTTTYGYDANDRMISVSGPMGYSMAYTYDARGNVTSETDALGRITTFQYDADGRETAELAPLGHDMYYTFDASGNVTAETDGNGHTTHYTYDADNNLLSETDPLGTTWLYGYDAAGNQTSVTDPNGHTTTYVYDSLNRVVQETDPLGGVTQYSYDEQGNLLSSTDPNGHVTQNVYNNMNLLTKTIDPLGEATQYQYDPANNVIAATDANGHTTHYGYDALNRQTSETDPAGGVWLTSYTPNDQVASTTDPLGRTNSYQHDALQRLTQTTDPTGASNNFTYDLMGNPTSQTDPLGRTTQYVYNAADELTSETDPLGATTQYTYDNVGNQTSITDPSNNTTTFKYDAADQLIQQTDPLGHSAYFQYDLAGNLIQSTDRDGRVIQYDYNANDQETSETWLQGNTPIYTAHYAYDPAGNLLSAGDNNSQYTFSYDANDQLKTADNLGTPGLPHIILTYGYDPVGNNTSVTDNSGVAVKSTFDSRDLLVNRTWSGGGIDPASYSQKFNAAWELVEQDRFADTTGTDLIAKSLFTYDPAGRVQTLDHLNAIGQALADYQYTYGTAGQLIQEVHHGVTFNYQYDKDGQLTNATRSDQSTPAVQSYDANGNRTDSGTVIGADNRVLADGNFTYQYDNEGNLIQKVDKSSGDITSYVYDFRNRLTDVTTTSPGGIVLHSEHYVYDVFDRRIAVTVNGATLYTVYDGDNAWADYNASGAVQARYLFGDNTDEIIARWQPGTGTAWYLTDQLGTVRDIINAGGQVIDHIDYSAVRRRPLGNQPGLWRPLQVHRRKYDAGTGLYYFRGRYYDPVQGRFLNEDPLGFLAGDANLYRYIGNQPTAGTDPFGDDALVERALEFQGNLFSTAAQAQIAAAINSSFNLLEAWAQDRLTAADLQMALDEVQSAGSNTLFAPLTAFGNAINAAGGFIQDVLNGAWKSAAYRDQLFQNISSTVVNSAFGLIMGPLGGPLMTIAAPQLLLTQVAFNGINALEAYQYYQQTGDARLFLIRSMRAGVNIGMTLMQWRLNLSPTCNCLGHCFPAGTLISTECGQRPIESIRAGERVWSMDLKDGQWKLRHVMETFTRVSDDNLLSVIFRDGSIQVTPGHPFCGVARR